MSGGRDDRDAFAECAQLARRAIVSANGAGIGKLDHRVLGAVVSFTALWSRKTARVYLGQLAAVAFGVDEAKPWQEKRTREALRRLADAGIVYSRWPRGRHPGSGPAYLVSLVPLPGAKSNPDPRDTSVTGSDPESGAPSTHESDPDPVPKATPILSRKVPQDQGPYREVSEEKAEEVRTGAGLDDLAAAAVRYDRAEVAGVVAGLRLRLGAANVDAAIGRIDDDSATFTRPRELVAAIERLVLDAVTEPPAATVDAPARRAEPEPGGTCPVVKCGSDMTERLSDRFIFCHTCSKTSEVTP